MFSNLKRWAPGTFHGLRRAHLRRYLDEFVFRWPARPRPPAQGRRSDFIAYKNEKANEQLAPSSDIELEPPRQEETAAG